MIYPSVFGFFLLEGRGGDSKLQNTESLLALGFKTHKQRRPLQVTSQRLFSTTMCLQPACFKSNSRRVLELVYFFRGSRVLMKRYHVAPQLRLEMESGSAGVRMVPFGWAAISKETVWLLPGASRSCLSSRQFPKPLADFPLWTVHLSGNEIGYRISHVAKPHWRNRVRSCFQK